MGELTTIPADPPFTLRARLLSPLADGATMWLPDGVIEVDASGRIRSIRDAADAPRAAETATDLRPLVVMPGLVDTHVHIPQIPAAGMGAGMDLLAWLERYVFSLERAFDVLRAGGDLTQLAAAPEGIVVTEPGTVMAATAPETPPAN